MPHTNPIDVLKVMLLARRITINEDSFDDAWFVEEAVDGGLFETGDSDDLSE